MGKDIHWLRIWSLNMTPDWSCMILRPKWTFYYLERLSLYYLSHQKKIWEVCAISFQGQNHRVDLWKKYWKKHGWFLLAITTITGDNNHSQKPVHAGFFLCSLFFFAYIHSVKTKLGSYYIGYSLCFPPTFPNVLPKPLKTSDNNSNTL